MLIDMHIFLENKRLAHQNFKCHFKIAIGKVFLKIININE